MTIIKKDKMQKISKEYKKKWNSLLVFISLADIGSLANQSNPELDDDENDKNCLALLLKIKN